MGRDLSLLAILQGNQRQRILLLQKFHTSPQEWTQDTFWPAERRAGRGQFVPICRAGWILEKQHISGTESCILASKLWKTGYCLANETLHFDFWPQASELEMERRQLPMWGARESFLKEVSTTFMNVPCTIWDCDATQINQTNAGQKAPYCGTFSWNWFRQNHSGNKIMDWRFVHITEHRCPNFWSMEACLGQERCVITKHQELSWLNMDFNMDWN